MPWNSNVLPADRADASSFRSLYGKSLSSSTCNETVLRIHYICYKTVFQSKLADDDVTAGAERKAQPKKIPPPSNMLRIEEQYRVQMWQRACDSRLWHNTSFCMLHCEWHHNGLRPARPQTTLDSEKRWIRSGRPGSQTKLKSIMKVYL